MMRIHVFLLAVLLTATCFAESPLWETEFLSADPGKLLQAAMQVAPPEDAGVHVLLDEQFVTFDAEGRRTTRERTVYRILKPAFVEDWSTVEEEWAPWNEARPEIRARVITQDGTVHMLDPATIDDAPAQDFYDDIYSDRRISRAPLPGVSAGALVEEEILLKENKPLYDRGVVDRYFFGSDAPILVSRLVLEAPASLPLRYVLHQLPGLEPRREEHDGIVRLTFERAAIEPLKSGQGYVPPDTPQWPQVVYASGKSWQEIAAQYSSIVDTQISGSDLARTVKKAVGKEKEPARIAAALLAVANRDVRYTGVEFGEAFLVPRSPAETLQRKYGDCKDKATLLVAMLRSAGLPAQVALLRAGTMPDVEPDLPGIGLFNHAIVYMPGNPATWMDPTDPYSRAGELPLADQGRYALVAAPESTGLIRTPEPDASRNRIVETREFFLSEDGPARVVETTEMWGSIESEERASYDDVEEKEVRTNFEDYVKREYLASKLDRFEYSDPKDIGKPFRIQLEMSGARRGLTGDDEAVVAIFHSRLTDYLPRTLTTTKEESQDKAKDKEKEEKRTLDFYLQEPYVSELRYRIVPPPGYSLFQLPESETVPAGPAKITREYSADANGVVTAVLRFDTVRNRYTPEECDAMRAAFSEIVKAGAILIRYRPVGMSYLAEGKIREALEEFRRLSALHPKEGRHHAQMARALLEGGLGEAARGEVRKAIELEPGSAYAHQVAGWVYQHDLIGRRFLKGFDRAASVAEYRKALEIDPDDTVAGADLAIVLEHNDRGKRYEKGADLDAAIELYRKFEQKIQGTALESNLPIALMWARKFAELKEWALKNPDSAVRDQMLLAGVGGSEGLDAALKEAAKIADPNRRRPALAAAGAHFMRLRMYPLSMALFDEAARGASNAAQLRPVIDMLRKVQRHEDMELADTDPIGFTKKFVIRVLQASEDGNGEGIPEMLASESRGTLEEGWVDGLARAIRAAKSAFPGVVLPPDVFVDIALSAATMTADGDDATGYRVRLKGGQGQSIFYLIREDGKCRLLATSEQPGMAGRFILRQVEAGKLDVAGQWLDWLREEMTVQGGDDPYAGGVFPRFWKKGQERDPGAMRVAAATLLILDKKPEDAIAVIEAARERAASGDRLQFDLALMWIESSAKKYGEALAAAERLAEAAPESAAVFSNRGYNLMMLDRWEDLRKVAEQRLALLPGDPQAYRTLAEVAQHSGDYKKIDELYRALIDTGKALAGDRNNLAWYALFEESPASKDLAGAIEEARKSVEQDGNPGNRHTLAALYAEAGDTTEARQVLYEALEDEAPQPHDWYVLGRLAEQYGLPDAAVSAYRKVEKPKPPEPEAGSTYILAQRRISALARPARH